MAQKRTSTEAGIIPVRTRNAEPKRTRLSPTSNAPSDSSDDSTNCSATEAAALQSTPETSDMNRQSSLSSVSAGDEEEPESDVSETATDDDSSEEEEEDESEEEIVTLGGPKRPEIDPKRVLEEAHKLHTRLQQLLPKLRKANQHLAENGSALNIENVGDNEQHIEMNLGLGVLEGQQDSDEEDLVIKESSGGREDGKDATSEVKGQPDAMQSLLGAEQKVQPSIEEVKGD